MATRNKTNSTKYHFIVNYNGKNRHNYLNYTLDTNSFDLYFSISPDNILTLNCDIVEILFGDKLVELKLILNLFEDIQLFIKKYPGSPFSNVINNFSSDTTSNIWLEYKN